MQGTKGCGVPLWNSSRKLSFGRLLRPQPVCARPHAHQYSIVILEESICTCKATRTFHVYIGKCTCPRSHSVFTCMVLLTELRKPFPLQFLHRPWMMLASKAEHIVMWCQAQMSRARAQTCLHGDQSSNWELSCQGMDEDEVHTAFWTQLKFERYLRLMTYFKRFNSSNPPVRLSVWPLHTCRPHLPHVNLASAPSIRVHPLLHRWWFRMCIFWLQNEQLINQNALSDHLVTSGLFSLQGRPDAGWTQDTIKQESSRRHTSGGDTAFNAHTFLMWRFFFGGILRKCIVDEYYVCVHKWSASTTIDSQEHARLSQLWCTSVTSVICGVVDACMLCRQGTKLQRTLIIISIAWLLQDAPPLSSDLASLSHTLILPLFSWKHATQFLPCGRGLSLLCSS